jgi:Iron-containing alcohol dehydrogenase
MVSTPGHVPFVVQEVTDLVRHDANERFAKVEHGRIALVDNHEYLLVRQILPSRLSIQRIIVANEKAREVGVAVLYWSDVTSKNIARDFRPQGFLDRNPFGVGQSEKDVRLSPERQSRVLMGASHSIGHVLGGTCGVPHYFCTAVMMPSVLRFNEPATGEAQSGE